MEHTSQSGSFERAIECSQVSEHWFYVPLLIIVGAIGLAMYKFLLQRLVQGVLVMLVVAFVSFAIFHFLGDPVNNMVGERAPLMPIVKWFDCSWA